MPRPLASLSSGLLARPGHAKPAMRPQGFGAVSTEDLGWNDMGTPAPSPTPIPPAEHSAPVPPVLVERAELTRAVAPSPRPKRAAAPAADGQRRAAFTLRLDAERHLQLRLASAVSGRSAQQLLVAALDAFFAAQPQVDLKARHVSGEK